jgi:hypothetical protein
MTSLFCFALVRKAFLFLPEEEKKKKEGGVLPEPVKAGGGKLKGLTIPMVGSQLPG